MCDGEDSLGVTSLLPPAAANEQHDNTYTHYVAKHIWSHMILREQLGLNQRCRLCHSFIYREG